eukprot:gene6309-12767_t
MSFPYKTILQSLNGFAVTQGNKNAWTFLDDKGSITDSFTYAELERVTTSLANFFLNSCDLKAGDRVLLVFFPGLNFTISILACFKCGIIAVPVFPPDPRRIQKDLHHFVNIQSNCGAQVALTHAGYNFAKKMSDIKNLFISKSQSWPELRWIQVDDVINRSKSKPGPISAPVPSSLDSADMLDSIAFLQYTSGSTSEPKGVMISHRNLAHNESIILASLKANQDTVCVSWLPQYHDMGLIGSYLGVISCGGSGYYLSPISFLKDPLVWIRSMSKYHATHTQ